MDPVILHALDRLRQLQGAWMDAVGFGAREAPCREVASRPGYRLRAYGGSPSGATLVIVPAPIKRFYIWDLAPEVSVVRCCLAAGLRVYLLEWTTPDDAVAACGLAEYADRFIREALDAVAADGGANQVLLAGHSLGGTLAAIFAALHPERVRGLVLLEAPLAFGENAGPFAPLAAAGPPGGGMDLESGTVPGSFLTAASVGAAPDTFAGDVLRDRLASLMDPQDARLHGRVMRWALDEFPMPGPLFKAVVEDLYRQDRFAQGTLRVGGRECGARALGMPVAAVIDPESTIIPPSATLSVLPEANVSVFQYTGDRGVALRHVGVLVGRSAHSTLWPALHRWMAGLADRPRQGGAHHS